jgi:orotate phosphoribosyltransferase
MPSLAARIRTAAHLEGDFLLRSGQRSTQYLDKYRFAADPALLRDIARALAPTLPPATEVLAGLELGGVPLATALSLETGIPAAYVRKQRKPYGTRKIAEGADVRARRVCIIEDVITTGGQVLASRSDLEEEGAEVIGVRCVVWRGGAERDPLRGAGLEWRALFTLEEILAAR